MDVVYTYVDGSNSEWLQQYAAETSIPLSDIRFLDHGELVFSLSLLRTHCNAWVRRVYVLHAGSGVQADTLAAIRRLFQDAPDRLRIVPQSDVLDGPTFSSCTVEANLWRLPGLSDPFVYSNDDMAFGRPFALKHFVSGGGLPWIDCSAVPIGHKICNMSQQHNENAWRLFTTRFPCSRMPHVHVSHFPSVMSVAGCERTWQIFGTELAAAPLVRCNTTINFQLLAALVTVEAGLGRLRTRAHLPPHGLARAFVEMQPEGLAHIAHQRPHFFCVNGVNGENANRFHEFCRQFLQKKGTAPAITRWTWSPDQDLPHLRDRQRKLGDDRGVHHVRPVPANARRPETPVVSGCEDAHSDS